MLIASIVIYINPEYKIVDPICTFMFSIITLITTTSVVKYRQVLFDFETLTL